MEIKSLILLIQLLVIIPVLIGTMWANAAGVNRKIKYIAFSWLTGFLTMMAAAQVLLVPMVLRRMSFTLFFGCYTVLLLVLCIFCGNIPLPCMGKARSTECCHRAFYPGSGSSDRRPGWYDE